MKLISLDYVAFQLSALQIRGSGNAIDSTLSAQVEPGSCQGITLKDYVDKLDEIGALLKLYQQLVVKDSLDFAKAGEALRRSDETLAAL